MPASLPDEYEQAPVPAAARLVSLGWKLALEELKLLAELPKKVSRG